MGETSRLGLRYWPVCSKCRRPVEQIGLLNDNFQDSIKYEIHCHGKTETKTFTVAALHAQREGVELTNLFRKPSQYFLYDNNLFCFKCQAALGDIDMNELTDYGRSYEFTITCHGEKKRIVIPETEFQDTLSSSVTEGRQRVLERMQELINDAFGFTTFEIETGRRSLHCALCRKAVTSVEYLKDMSSEEGGPYSFLVNCHGKKGIITVLDHEWFNFDQGFAVLQNKLNGWILSNTTDAKIIRETDETEKIRRRIVFDGES